MCDRQFSQNLERFKIALEKRNFEIDMFWRRSNYFLLLNTSVGAGAGVAAVNGGYLPFLFFCVIGVLVCVAWRKISSGTRYWQVFWEQVVVDIQGDIGLNECDRPECAGGICNAEGNPCRAYDFFSPAKEGSHVRARVKKALILKGNHGEYNPQGYEESSFDSDILKKPSVSEWMYRTANFFLGSWIAAAIYAFLCMLWRDSLNSFCVAICPVIAS